VAVIAIVTSAPPLTSGGHLVIAHALEQALRDAGHRAGVVTTPSNRFGRQGAAYLANWLTDVGMTGDGERVDQIITMRFPSYAVRHPRHVCWLNHTMREYYDLWETFAAGLSPQGRLKEAARRTLIRAADTRCFTRHVTRLFAQSGTVQARLARWNGVTSEVVHPPPPPRPYRCDDYGDYVFFTSRLAPLKRADLLLRAIADPAAGGARCVIGGEGEEQARLVALARELGVHERVSFPGRLGDAALVDHLARCRAVVFIPRLEDYGLVTTEAFASAKAVITCTDSGGPTELVRDGENGLVVAPEAPALAGAIARLAGDRALAERMGQRALADAAALSWPRVVDRLVLA
jgi:glycosyltransferase involved in cell wall biosynthesis